MSIQPVIQSPSKGGWAGSRRARLAFVGVLAASATIAAPLLPASAAVPAFPDNLVVFPDRDFITIEGFQDHLGEVATVTVSRNGGVVGSAKSAVATGDVAFEINHPGGVCWGADTNLKVTPDIVAGDLVSISFPNGESFDTTVQDAAVTTKSVLIGQTLTVSGRIAAGVNQAQMEQRVINPDLKGTTVARRDIRAIPGPLTVTGDGYASSLEFSGETFTATYAFENLATAQVAAAGGGERAMTWQAEDTDGNRQGLTIAEFGELGGPGMGGCPAGPADVAAPAGSYSAVRSASNLANAQVTWTPATAAPGAAPVTGYSVVALGPVVNGLQSQVGVRTGGTATTATITGLVAGTEYTYEVRSIAGAGMSAAFALNNTATPVLPTDQTTPRLTVTPTAGAPGIVVEASSVTAASEAGADLYYAVGTSALTGDLPSDAALLYTGPIPITAQTELHFAAFDRAGNTETVVGTYAPSTATIPVLAGPTGVTAVAGQASAKVSWAAVTGAGGYRVTATSAATGAATVAPVEVTALTTTLTGMTAGVNYSVTVATKNSAGVYGAESAPVTTVPTAVTDRVTIASARWRAGDFRVVGTGSSVGAIVTVRTGSATGPAIGSASVTAPVAPATVGDYSIRVRGAAANTNPRRIWVTSSNGGTAGPFTVAG